MTKKIFIDGQWYDITDFVKRHPGGSVIEYYENQDATHVYQEMHYRSNIANNILKSLPKLENIAEPTEDSNKHMLADFCKWRQSLEDRGFFKTDISHVCYRLNELICIFFMATWCMGQETLFWKFIGVLLYGLFGGRCGWVQHEGGHCSLTGNKKVDKRIQKITMGFGTLLGGSLWNSMHNKHHATTQKEDHDVDLDTMPFVLFNQDVFKKTRGVSKLWLQFQSWTFIPLTSGVFVPIFWVYYLHPRKIIRDRDYEQGFYTLLGHIGRTTIIYSVSDLSLLQSYLCVMASMYVTSTYLFGHFSTSHTFMPVVKKDENPNWVEYSLHHTVDIDTQNPVVCWLMGYLNCQCVHHLFPQMPQFRQPYVSKELRVFAKKWGLSYNHIGYFEAWRKTFGNLENVGKLITN